MTMTTHDADATHAATAAAIAASDGRLAPVAARVGAAFTWMFRIGAALLVAGILLAIARREPLDAAVDPLGRVLPELLAGHAGGVIDLAILWFMAAPVVASIVVLGGFLRLGDRRYALVTIVVLLVLSASIARAIAS